MVGAGGALAAARHAARVASVRVALQVPAVVSAGGLVSFAGSVSGASSARMVAQRRLGSRWVALARGSLGRGGRFVLTWGASSKAGRLEVRVLASLARGGLVASVVRVVVVRAAAGPAAVVSGKAQVLAASTIAAAPAPGSAGALRYAGANSVQVGQIVAIGEGPATPDGFLGRVTAVSSSGGETVLSTVPASLVQVVQSGAFDVSASSSPSGMLRRGRSIVAHAASVKVQCEGSADANVTAAVSVGASIEARGSFSWFSLKSASVTGKAQASASLDAELDATGSCTLAKTTLVTIPGPKLAFSIGFIPVVLTSTIPVYLDAGAQIDASVSTSIGGGFSAQAGVGWTKGDGFYPIDQFTPSFSFQPPTLSANASVDANLTPTVEVTLDGFAHADLSLEAGLALDANTAANPWWTLTAPVALSADLDLSIPDVLDLSSPTLNIYKHTFTLAHADGPFGNGAGGGGGGGGGSSASVTVSDPGNQTASVGSAVSLQIHASDSDGGALTYSATGLPAGLSIDPATGLITGTPTTAGAPSVTVTAQDASGPSGSTQFTWTVTSSAPAVGVPWTLATPWQANIYAAPGQNLLVCGGSSDSMPAVQSLSDAGALNWAAQFGSNLDCHAAVGDAAGNSYVASDLDNGAETLSLNSYTASGSLRWSVASIPTGDPPELAIGADGNLYVAENDGNFGWQIVGYDTQTGAPTGFDVDGGEGVSIGLYAYPGGLADVHGDGVTYYSYSGSVIAQYSPSEVGSGNASFAGGANGLVFVAGVAGLAGSAGYCNVGVAAITPSGVQWQWQNTASTILGCQGNGTGLVATPDGGVVVQLNGSTCQGPGSNSALGALVSLSATGTVLWSENVPAPSGYANESASSACFPTVADDAGNVVIGQNFDFTCGSPASSACSGVQFTFLNDTTGATTAPAFAQTGDAAASWGLGNTSADGELIFNPITCDGGDLFVAALGGPVVGVPVSGLTTDYRLTVQEMVDP